MSATDQSDKDIFEPTFKETVRGVTNSCLFCLEFLRQNTFWEKH